MTATEGWQALVVEAPGLADIPAEVLRRPTIGWHRRQAGLDGPRGMAPEARHLMAVLFVAEARRRLLWERLDPILAALHNGADPTAICDRLRQTADDVGQPDSPALAWWLARHPLTPTGGTP